MDNGERVRQMLEAIVIALVDDKNSVSVQRIDSDTITTILVRVANEDIGKVIGKQGRTARAIRTILYAIAAKLGQRFELNVEPSNPAN